MTIKLHGTKTRTAKALLEVNRSCRRVRMVLEVYLRLTWTEMETWTWQVLLLDNKIAWYENTDGKGTFGSQQIVSTSAVYAYSVFAADLDGDGDMDLASASYLVTIKLHGTKTRTAKALLEVNRSCRRVRMVLKVYLRLTWTEMETWTWQVLLK